MTLHTITLRASDPRGAKAVAIATNASQWLKCRDHYGRKLYGIPSSKGDGRYYLVTRTSCDCPDARRHMCKHVIAVNLWCDLQAERQQPASWTQPQRGVIPASEIDRED